MVDVSGIWPGWRIEDVIGKGAYGTVYRVSRGEGDFVSYAAAKLIEIPQSEAEVASLRAMGMDQASIRDFQEKSARAIMNEIAVMESLKGAPNVVFIEDYQLIEHEDGIGWSIWIRMELLKGLVDVVRQNGAPSVDEAVGIGIDVARALELCHSRGIIHRDVKPENVFVSRFGDYKLGDFGIARQIERDTHTTYSQKGTGQYMAPEVVRGEHYDLRVDIYSLGIMLYRLLNGLRYPFLPAPPDPITPQDLHVAQMMRLRGDSFPPPCNADDELADIILKACAFDPADRYASARELADALSAWRMHAPERTEEVEVKYVQVVPGDVRDDFYTYESSSGNVEDEESFGGAAASHTVLIMDNGTRTVQVSEPVEDTEEKPQVPDEVPDPPASPGGGRSTGPGKTPLIVGALAALAAVVVLALVLGPSLFSPAPKPSPSPEAAPAAEEQAAEEAASEPAEEEDDGRIPIDEAHTDIERGGEIYLYDGTEKKPEVISVELDGVELRPGVDYTVRYENNVEPGVAWAVIEGIGSYKGTRRSFFVILKDAGYFTDVPLDNWAAGVIYFASEQGYILGRDDVTFAPNDAVTSDEVADGLKSLLGHDVDLGALSGKGELTRTDLALAITKTYQDETGEVVPDELVEKYASVLEANGLAGDEAKAMAWCIESRIYTPGDDGSLNAGDLATRAVFAKALIFLGRDLGLFG